MLPSFATDTVEVITPGVKVDHGNLEPDWTNTTTRVVAGCSIQPTQGSEDTDHRVAGVTITHRGWLPPDDPITSDDRVVWEGVAFDVVGHPQPWRVGSVAHTEILLTYPRG